MFAPSLQLAQAIEAAGEGLNYLERIQAGGVPLICLVIAVVLGTGYYLQLKRNVEQSDDQISKAEQREQDALEATTKRLAEQETMMREMLTRDLESQEAQLAAVQAVKGFTHQIKELQTSNEGLSRIVENLAKKISELEERIRRGAV